MEVIPTRFVAGLNVEADQLMDNIRANVQRKGIPRIGMRKAVVCGGGPSLGDHLDEIRDAQTRGFDVWALNGAGKYLLEQGIVPTSVFVIDGRAGNADFVTPFDPRVSYFIGSACDPCMFNALADHDKVYMVHTAVCDGAVELLGEVEPGASVLGSSFTVGMQALNLLNLLAYKVVHLYGYDSNNRSGHHHAYAQSLNDGQSEHLFEVNGKEFSASGMMANQANDFIAKYRRYEALGMNIQVIGEGLLPEMWRYHERLRQGAPLEITERAKYEKVWSLHGYREHSPGEQLVDAFCDAVGEPLTGKVLDLGCGTGRASLALQWAGFDVLAVDFARNARDPEAMQVPFLQANLWELPEDVSGDWGFCCDVMEHIPPDKVDTVLRNIASACEQGAFFQISFRQDAFGSMIGEPLHLSVHGADWWHKTLAGYWSNVEMISFDEDARSGVFICR